MRRLSILALLFVGTMSIAAEPLTPVANDEQDLILLHAARPYRIRLHLQIAGRSFQAQWHELFSRLFRFLDQDEDGVLSAKEMEHAPSSMQLRAIIAGASELEADAPPAVAEVTDNPKVAVTEAQLRGYYQRQGVAPWQAEWVSRTSDTDLLDAEICKQISKLNAEKLTRLELQKATEVLFRNDKDSDGILTLNEIVRNAGYQGFMVPTLLGVRDGPIILADQTDKGRSVTAQRILKKYSRNKNKEISREEIRLPDEVWSILDRNKNGKLDHEELAAWLDLPPDLELVSRLDSRDGESLRLIPGPGAKPHALTATTRFSRLGAALTALPGERVEVIQVEGMQIRLEQVKQSSLGLFKMLDRNRDGFVDSKEAFQPPFGFVPYLRLADRNGDGKVSEMEFGEILDLQSKLITRVTMVTVLDRGRSLFDLLDADHDHRLSRRELTTAWDRLAPWAEKSETIDLSKLPRQFQVVICQGNLTRPNGDPGAAAAIRPEAHLRGPTWFRKMDRNADGDLSREEFLGTAEQFKKIDRDGDGLIDRFEAEQVRK